MSNSEFIEVPSNLDSTAINIKVTLQTWFILDENGFCWHSIKITEDNPELIPEGYQQLTKDTLYGKDPDFNPQGWYLTDIGWVQSLEFKNIESLLCGIAVNLEYLTSILELKTNV